MKTVVAIPMKDLAESKTRLSPYMSCERRAHLSSSLFDRALTFFESQFPSTQRLVVTSSRGIAERARQGGSLAISEGPPAGLNAAAEVAFAWARANAFDRLILVPADIPVWLAQEARQLLESADRNDVAIARAGDGGTNAIVLNLNRVCEFNFLYGHESALLHEKYCASAGLSCEVSRLPFMGHDIDTIEDCLVLSHSMRFELLLA
ncbi:2-phospho-L-lactate guanylyltransferase [Variovorax sp. dw_308]|uniref:2-phospho-L-lactate guanylyltransferase n=1 Tax=Variovorax sp. dw_308 TaxID=2721546 RepID=UPI001C43F003|nr:2-phospho-L-lactate guanylyltransferase [Variovorax sp. dw_308]